MKTNTIIKHTATMISAAVLLTLPANAVQHFNKTTNYTTGDSNFGAVASFYANDNEIAPSGTTPGSYSVTAGGSVAGKVLGGSVTALSGNGTVKAMSNNTGTFSGTLSALGVSLVNVSNRALPYASSHYIRTWSASKSIPFSIFFIPFNVTGKVNASVDAYFRVDAVYSTLNFGAVRGLDIKMGPVADMAASATASVGVGIDGFASLSVGATGNLKLGKAALTASAVISPTFPVLTTATTTTSLTSTTSALTATRTDGSTASSGYGAQIAISLIASTSGITGSLDVFAKAELWPFGSKTAWANIASYSSGSASTTLFGPVTYRWF